MRKLLLLFLIIVCLCDNSYNLQAQDLTTEQVDSLVERSLESFPQAAIAIAVVKDGKIIHSKGYGLASIESGAKANENTLFAIASNSKAFTSAALAILVDEGKLSWNDRVVDYIPEFRMYDPYVTENFTIIDLLTHRSGLGLGAGDLMLFPDGGDFTVQDVLKSFRYQEPVSPFRTKYDYDNLLYIVAGELIARISGLSWVEFIESRIMEPLGMINSAGSFLSIRERSNIAMPHSSSRGQLRQISSYSNELTNAAGGIYASVNDLSKWMIMQLNGGRYGLNLEKQLFSQESQKQMWTPYTNISFSVIPDSRYRHHFTSYGLGWQIADYKGYVTLSHGGGLPGMLSQTTLIPGLNLGVVVLTNSEPGGLSYFTLTWSILDSYLGAEKRDWLEVASAALKSTENRVDSVTTSVWETVKNADKGCLVLENFVGIYEDRWFGKVEITLDGGKLWFRSLRSPKLHGEMYYYKAGTFAVKWDYTDMPCDAFASFTLDKEGRAVMIKMKGISPNIDFSFDFQDLELVRIDGNR